MNIEVVVGQVLFVEQQAESNIKGFTLEHWLAFTQAASSNLHSRQLSSFIRVNQLALAGKTISLALEDEVNLSQETFPRAYILSIGQTLFIWAEAIAEGFAPLVQQSLGLNQTVEVDVAKAAFDTLTMTETIALSLSRNFTIEQTFGVDSDAVGYMPDKYWSSYEIEVVEP